MSLKEKTQALPRERRDTTYLTYEKKKKNPVLHLRDKIFSVPLVVTSEDKLHSGSDVTQHQLNYKSRAADASREVTRSASL